MIRWLVFAPAALLAFVAPAEERISLTVEEPVAVLPIAAGQFEVLVHSDQDCGSVTVDPYVELLDETGSVVAADDDGWHRQGDCLASRLSGVAGAGFQIRVRGCCGRLYGSVRVEWLSGTQPEMSVSTTLPVTVPESTLETTTTSTPATTVEPATTVAASTTVLEATTLPATALPTTTTTEVISWPTTTIPDRTTATAALPDPVVSTSVPSSTTELTTTTVLANPITTTIAKPALAEPDLFDGTHDDVIPEGSTISVAQRRTVVAVSAVFFIAVPRPSTSGSTGRRR